MAFTHSRRSAAVGIRALAAIGAIALLSAAGVTAAAAAPLEYEESHQWSPSDGRLSGRDVVVDGDLVMMTEYYGSNQTTGSVRIADLSGDEAALAGTLIEAPEGVRGFGASIAIDAELGLAMVGSWTPKQVHLYSLDDSGSWEPLHVIDAPTEGDVRNFGEKIAYSDGHLAVAAPNSTVDGMGNVGRVFVYDVSEAVSTGPDAITMSEAESPEPIGGGIFGQALELENDWLVVAAPQATVPYKNNIVDYAAARGGPVSVFRITDGAVEFVTELAYPVTDFTAPTTANTTWGFGTTLAIGGDTAYVGSAAEENIDATAENTINQGAIYAFDLTTGEQVGPKLVGAGTEHVFGLSAAVHDDTLLVGATDSASEHRGQVYVYDIADLTEGEPAASPLSRQSPEPLQLLRASDAAVGGRFGTGAIDVNETYAVVGSTSAGATGTVTVFEALAPVTRSVAAADASAAYGTTASVEVTVDTDGPDGGEVVVSRDGVILGSAQVADHAATVPLVTDLPAGSHILQVEFTDSGGRTATTDATVEIEPAATETAAERTDDGISGQVVGEHGTVPTGTVELRVADTVIGTAELDDSGAFAADVTAEDAVTVLYLGDENHLASELTLDAIEPDESGAPTASPDPSDSDAPAPSGPGESEEPGDGLPRTGSAIIVPGLIAAVLALIGGGVLLRRRRSA